MAIRNKLAVTGVKLGVESAAIVSPGSAYSSEWIVAQFDATSVTSGAEADPGAETDSDHIWIPVPVGATRLWVGIRNAADMTTFATAPQGRIFGTTDVLRDVQAPIDGTRIIRVDDPDDFDGASFVFPATATAAQIQNDALFDYQDIANTGVPFDLRGSRYILMMITVAAVTNATTVDVIGQFQT